MTEKSPRLDNHGKSDKALKLREQGLTPAQIAERLGSNPRSVSAMILDARRRREKMAGEVSA